MRRMALCLGAAMLCSAGSVFAAEQTWTGTISDSASQTGCSRRRG
jgi:hypothetical protein